MVIFWGRSGGPLQLNQPIRVAHALHYVTWRKYVRSGGFVNQISGSKKLNIELVPMSFYRIKITRNLAKMQHVFRSSKKLNLVAVMPLSPTIHVNRPTLSESSIPYVDDQDLLKCRSTWPPKNSSFVTEICVHCVYNETIMARSVPIKLLAPFSMGRSVCVRAHPQISLYTSLPAKKRQALTP